MCSLSSPGVILTTLLINSRISDHQLQRPDQLSSGPVGLTVEYRRARLVAATSAARSACGVSSIRRIDGFGTLPTPGSSVCEVAAGAEGLATSKWAKCLAAVGTSPSSSSFFNILSLSENNREKVEPMSTVTSADGTIIDYDAYGD